MAEVRVQRRLAAILAADVVGYSRLMEADEAGTLARLKTLRAELLYPKTEEFGGRIVKTMGDGVLIEFPSAVAAVEHALSVQQGMAERESDPEDHRIPCEGHDAKEHQDPQPTDTQLPAKGRNRDQRQRGKVDRANRIFGDDSSICVVRRSTVEA